MVYTAVVVSSVYQRDNCIYHFSSVAQSCPTLCDPMDHKESASLSITNFEQFKGVGDRQGSLTCSSPWGHKDSDTTEQLN